MLIEYNVLLKLFWLNTQRYKGVFIEETENEKSNAKVGSKR